MGGMAVAAQDHDDEGKHTTTLSERIEERIARVPQEARTPDRDEAAREILRWQAEGEWPLTGPEMAERSEYSPQHFRNVLSWFSLEEDGFHDEAGESTRENHVQRGGVTIEIPEDADVESYARGYVAGYLDAHSSGE